MIKKPFCSVVIIWVLFIIMTLGYCSGSGGGAVPIGSSSGMRNISDLESRIYDIVNSSANLSVKTIGNVTYFDFNAPVWAVTFTPLEPAKYHVLICGGTHGNEPAGPEGVLALIQTLADNPSLYANISIELIPLINPWGWVHNTRENGNFLDVNRNFFSSYCQETKIVTDFISKKYYNLVIDHHESPGHGGFFIYRYNNPVYSDSIDVINSIKNLGYPLMYTGGVDGIFEISSYPIDYNNCNSALTYCMQGLYSNNIYCTETPSDFPLVDRIRMDETAQKVLLDHVQTE